VKVHRAQGAQAWSALAPRWRELADRSCTSHLFNDFDWLDAWYRAFAGEEQTLKTYVVEDEGRAVAALPLLVSANKQARTLFNHYLGRSDLLLDPQHPQALQAILTALREDARYWNVLQFDQVPEDSPTFVALCQASPGLHQHGVRNLSSPYLELSGDYDGWYSSRFSGRKRQQDRRRMRQLQKRGGQISVLTEPEAVRACFEDGLRVEALGWKGDEKSAMNSRPETAAFMRDVVQRFAQRGAVRLIQVQVEDRLAAFLLGFVHKGTLYFHKTGFDPAFDAQSPGRLALLRSIEDAFEQGLQRYDFLGAPDNYKLQCSPTVRPHSTVFVYHRGAQSRLLRHVKRTFIPMAKRLGRPGEALPVSVDR